jgi:hypothetical protein
MKNEGRNFSLRSEFLENKKAVLQSKTGFKIKLIIRKSAAQRKTFHLHFSFFILHF